jgi:hypothetical protein
MLGLWLASCGSTSTSNAGDIDMSKITLAPEEGLPVYVQDAPPHVREAYRFALANPEVLAQIPCYCGCNNQGHMNNMDCYVVPNTGGDFEPHAAY